MALYIKLKAPTSIQRYLKSHDQWLSIYHFVAWRSHLFHYRQAYAYRQTSASRDTNQNQMAKTGTKVNGKEIEELLK